MFYSQFILAKKGPLGTIWIAAHLERKLRKNQITETNIIDSVDSILFPEVPIALRLSGHLLLGVVRIYSRKVEYLFHDCSEALIKIKQAFHSSSVDLPPEAATAPFHSVTLPETFDFDELESYLSRDQAFKGANGVAMDHHVTARDLITLQDRGEERAHFGALFTLDERFPEGSNPYSVLDFDEESVPHKLQAQAQSKVAPLLHEMAVPILEEDVLPPLPMEDEMDLPIMDIEKNHEEPTPEPEVVRMDVDDMYGIPQELPVKDSIQQYAPTSQVTGSALPQVAGPLPNLAPQSDTEMAPGVAPEVPEVEKLRSAVGPAEEDVFLTALENELDMGKERTDLENISQEHRTIQVVERRSKFAEDTPVLQEETPLPSAPSPTSFRSSGRDALGGDDVLRSILGGRRSPALKVMETPAETPVKPKPGRRKRKPAFDDVVALSSYYMKKQLTNVEDLRRVRRKAPCTEYDIWRVQRESHVEQKFSGPCIPGLGIVLRRLYDRVFVSKMKLPAAKLSQKSTPKDVPSKIQPDQTEESLATDILTPIADASPFMTLNIEDVLREQVDGAQPNDEVQASLPRKIAELTQGKEKLQIPSVQEGDIQLHRPPTPTVLDIEPPLLLVDLPVEEEQHAIFEQTDKGMDLQEVEIEAGENGVEIDAFPMEDGAEIVRDEPDKVHETTADFDIERQVEAAGSQAGTKTPHTLTSGPSFEEQSQKSLGFLADSNDTVYFVADEDGVLEDLDYHSKRALIQDSGGWSARTRGVAQYLKTAFEKLEAKSKSEIRQPACLSLDGLLKGRTRKESARMFFETLVLKSKDYIQVKQDGSFSDIHLYATPRLLKAVF